MILYLLFPPSIVPRHLPTHCVIRAFAVQIMPDSGLTGLKTENGGPSGSSKLVLPICHFDLIQAWIASDFLSDDSHEAAEWPIYAIYATIVII